ncbi:hypothetical protein T12_613 [Trichinella patagoniensis]|uniref:Uncharacterized protein n=1 Tax=Trichinella patagoniensis TaxID=990121 RepID=A0A0V0Z5H1_9BILA|nr:hypothetical protein T12_613 [Trichinella patagoniensis]
MLISIFFESGSQCPLNIRWKIESAWDVGNGDMKILYLLVFLFLHYYVLPYCSKGHVRSSVMFSRIALFYANAFRRQPVSTSSKI